MMGKNLCDCSESTCLRDAIHNRRDFTLQSGANVTWRPYKNFSVGCAFAWVGNYSNVDTLDYAVLLPFVGVGAQVSF